MVFIVVGEGMRFMNLIVLLISLTEQNPEQPGTFDAHAVYAGDDAVSFGRWSQLATLGIRNALTALLARYGSDSCNPSTALSRPPGKSSTSLSQNLFPPSTSTKHTYGS